MPPSPATLLGHVRRLIAPPAPGPATDAALLARFVRDRDEAAFGALVGRHGAMVLRACRRALGDDHAAEDCAQATFLVLARKAAAVRPPEALAAWLHGVARRVALKAGAQRRRACLEPLAVGPTDPRPGPVAQASAREMVAFLDEEVQLLPVAYRLPVILCALEGKTQEEAARELGWTEGSVKGRLERGRKRLHERLARRGLALSAALALVEAARGAPGRLRALSSAKGLSPRVTALAEEALRGMSTTPFKALAALLLTAGVLAAGAGALAPQPLTTSPPQGAAVPPLRLARAPAPAPAGPDRDAGPLPAGAVVRIGTSRFWQPGEVTDLAFSGDGTARAAGGPGGTIWLWGLPVGTRRRQWAPKGIKFRAERLAWSADGKVVATAGEGVVRLWDAATGAERHKLDWGGRAGSVPMLAFAPDGKTLATWTNASRTLRLWDVATGTERSSFKPGVSVRDIDGRRALALSGSAVAAAAGDGTVRVWSAATGKELHRLPTGPNGAYAVAFSRDGKALAVAELQRVRVWDDRGKELYVVPGLGRAALAMRFSPDGKTLVLAADDGDCRVCDGGTGKERRRVKLAEEKGVANPVRRLAFSPDVRLAAWVGWKLRNHVHIFDLVSGKELRPAREQPVSAPVGIAAPALAPNGKLMVTTCVDGRVRLWDTSTGKVVRALDGTPEGVYYLVFTSDAKSVVGWGNAIHVWDAANGKELRRLPIPVPSLRAISLALSPDGKSLAVGDVGRLRAIGPQHCQVRLIDLAGGKVLWQSDGGHADRVSSLTFSPDGKMVVSAAGGSDDVQFWGAATGKAARRPLFLPGSPFRNPRIAFMPGGKVLAVVSDSFTDKGERAVRVAFRDLASGKELSHFDAPRGATAFLAFEPDGRRASFVKGDEVIVCALPSGKEVQRLRGDSGPVYAAAFAGNGKVMATGNADGTILIWRTK
jgi:RNA polymerase sigma factor (sigma-70 family)